MLQLCKEHAVNRISMQGTPMVLDFCYQGASTAADWMALLDQVLGVQERGGGSWGASHSGAAQEDANGWGQAGTSALGSGGATAG